MIEAIVFDVDDTIYDQQQPFRNAVKRVIPAVTEEDMAALYIRFRYHSDENFPKVMANEWTLEYMRAQRISQSLLDLDYPLITEADGLLFQKVYEDELANICMHEEVRRTLNYLQEKQIPIGIITNGPTDHQYKKVKQLRLEDWVASDRVIISQATGFQKPEVEIFKLAEKTFGFSPETTLYVGDSFENDVVGSKNSDWHALWFNHRNRAIPAGSTPLFDWEITSFEQLLETIQALF
ncbi:HAD family hydrolase [Enterococcus sp. JM4C]|uniref:HAD family hydrolase n=1 Tax=Candidatus Enterococcus huntleyi TaxID=1857217 RepID=UPI00137B698F|nr:HAD family hydrolase [Enterococcus sp. JM4C]KAF1296448.1 HAD family hydrolase [Enterococcus sp. JM4C]